MARIAVQFFDIAIQDGPPREFYENSRSAKRLPVPTCPRRQAHAEVGPVQFLAEGVYSKL